LKKFGLIIEVINGKTVAIDNVSNNILIGIIKNRIKNLFLKLDSKLSKIFENICD
tara:strand:+ start:97 stop:261 length:165 start_codon:yes stop_codon:yes gene_type:complete